MAAGVRRLGLRNLIDRHGKQEYFDTLKLQFGFTRQGARRRLAEWLGGLPPLTVKILSGDDPEYLDLKSESFITLWKTLKRFRDGQIANEYVRLVLQASPWVCAEWVEDLLEGAARGRVAGPGAERAADAADAVAGTTDGLDRKAGASERLCEPILERPLDARPRLVLRLSERRMSDLLIDCTAVELSIDSKTVDRWSLQEAGDWRGRRELVCPDIGSKVNLRPKLLLVRTHEGRVVKEFDLHEIGLGEPVLIFDLGSGRLVDAGNMFDPTREYAVVCDSDLSVHGASRPFLIIGGRSYRTGRPWGEDFKIACEQSLYWTPRIGERKSPAPLRLSMEFCKGPPVEIGSAAPILIAGAPSDAESVSLRVGNFSYDLSRDGEAWRTGCAVSITAKLAVGEEVARVRVTGPNYNRSATPTPSVEFARYCPPGECPRRRVAVGFGEIGPPVGSCRWHR